MCVGPDIQFLFFAFRKTEIIKSEPISSAETALNKVSQIAMQFKNNEYISLRQTVVSLCSLDHFSVVFLDVGRDLVIG